MDQTTVRGARSATLGAEQPLTRTAESDASRSGIIVHSHLRWDFVWQRPQQIVSRLALHHPVLFLEEPQWRDQPVGLQVSEPHPNVVRVVPLMRQEDHRTVDAQCNALLGPLQRALASHPLLAGRFDQPVQWFYSPMTAPSLLDQFGSATVVYDCMDELANFLFAPADIGQREKLLLARADLVFTGGRRLYESKSRHHANVHFFGCGVDFAHYAQARQSRTTIPAEVATLPRPVLGYFGVIDERIDYELLRHLAQAFRGASIVMVGPVVKVNPESLPREVNVHWLGQRSYAELPALVNSFDVCLMPFALNEATQYINPTKTLEYMAAGKPVVSTAVPDVVSQYAPVVDVADSHAAFAAAAQRAVTAPRHDALTAGIEQARKSSWESIVMQMRAHLLAAAEARAATIESRRVCGALAQRAGAL